jgi:hypothetical protein
LTHVAAVYPSGDGLPRNALRLYVEFSGSMGEGDAWRCVHLVRDEDGAPLDDALLAPQFELWDRDFRRLTILLDPGRIKRGLGPHAEAGYPLEAGVPVRLVVDTSFRDEGGRPLESAFEKRYEVGPDVRSRVSPEAWRVHAPAAGSRGAMVVELDRPLDHGMLHGSIRVYEADGLAVPGEVRVAGAERSWLFVPSREWRRGAHRLVVDSRLEDVCGNSVARVFDRDLARANDDPRAADCVSVEFDV